MTDNIEPVFYNCGANQRFYDFHASKEPIGNENSDTILPSSANNDLAQHETDYAKRFPPKKL